MGVLVPNLYLRDLTQGSSIVRRSDEQTISSNSSNLVYFPSNGAWSDAVLDSQSCTQSAESSVSSGSYVEFKFIGTSLTVNVVKNIDGAPYNVTLDGSVHSYDSYADSEQCASDFQVAGLPAREHLAVVMHNGNSSLLASGRSQLRFVSFQYTPSANLDPLPTPSHTSVAAIVGGVLGGIAFLVLVCGIIWWRWRRARLLSTNVKLHPTKEGQVSQPYEVPPEPVPFAVSSSESQPNQSNTALLPIRRTKGDNDNHRYVRSSPWNSSSSHPNNSRQNINFDPANQPPWSEGSSQSMAESPPPSSIATPYQAFSVTETSSNPSSSQDASRPRRPRHYPAPSTVGESVIIDDPNYIPPPSYSPPPTNHPRMQQSIQQTMTGKAVYDGTDAAPASGMGMRGLPLPPTQDLSPAAIDLIAQRVVDIMRSPAGSTGASNLSPEAQHPQVQQAVQAIISRQDNLNSNPTLRRNDRDDNQKQ